MSRNIVFLDIDGVMLPGRAILLPGNPKAISARLAKNFEESNPTFDPIAVQMINNLITLADAKIVLNTTWAFGVPPAPTHIKNALIANGVLESFAEDWATYRRLTGSKLTSIGDWIDDNGLENDSYLALDDDIYPSSFEESVNYWSSDKTFKAELIQPSYDDGLTWKHYKQALKFFGVKGDNIAWWI
jgi:hypothetical protein